MSFARYFSPRVDSFVTKYTSEYAKFNEINIFENRNENIFKIYHLSFGKRRGKIRREIITIIDKGVENILKIIPSFVRFARPEGRRLKKEKYRKRRFRCFKEPRFVFLRDRTSLASLPIVSLQLLPAISSLA